jgi:hypothetical protein
MKKRADSKMISRTGEMKFPTYRYTTPTPNTKDMGKKDEKPAKPENKIMTVDVASKEGREILAKMGETIANDLAQYKQAVGAARALCEFLEGRLAKISNDGKGFCAVMSKLFPDLAPSCGTERGAGLPEMLLGSTRFKIDPKDIEFRRVPKYDTKDSIAFCVTVRSSSEKDGCTESVSESFILNVSNNYHDSVAAFDKAISGLEFVKFEEKTADTCKCKKECAGKCDGKCKTGKKDVSFSKVLASRKALEGLKQFLLKGSSYAVPSTRFKVLFDKVDRKSQKFVYELRFFQKNYRKDETQSYERALLRIRMDGDCGDLIVKRFDKAVGELRFNEFPKKPATPRKK